MQPSSKKIRVLLVSDTDGDDDEGMKKIARKLSIELNSLPNICSKIVPPREVLKVVSKFDVLHYIGGPSYKSILLSWLAKLKGKNITTILTFTNPFWGILANTLIRIIPPDHVIVASEFWKEWAESIGIPFSKFSISGVDPERFVPVDRSVLVSLRKDLNLPEDKLIVLHVGHLKTDRNLTALLEVQNEEDFQVVVVCSTTTMQSIELLGTLCDAGCIVISTYQQKIEEYYQAADCYAFPTISKKAAVQVPLSVLEALACGTPVASTPFGGLPDLFSESHGVHYYQPGQTGAGGLINTIRLAIKSNSCNLENKHSWPAIAATLESLYSDISQ